MKRAIKSSCVAWGFAFGLVMFPTSPGALAQNDKGQDLQAQISTLLAENDLIAAEVALRRLLEREPSNATALFQLAQLLHQQEDLAGAEQAYTEARAAGFQPSARVDYHLARIKASQGYTSSAISLLQRMAETSGPIASTVQQTSEFAVLADEPTFLAILDALAPCPMAEQRHFDFWVGEWQVTAAGQPYGGAVSRIESIQNGCAVLENYTAGNFAGTSINFYDTKRNLWHQSWMSNTGNVFYAEGGLNAAGEMVLSDRGLEISEVTGTINTVTWTPLPDGRVRQHWQASTDDGETWQTVFDGYYERVATGE